MSKRNLIRSALHSTLNRFLSRNNDFRGYWLLGQIPLQELCPVHLNLLAEEGPEDVWMELTWTRSRAMLHQQLAKNGIPLNAQGSAWVQSCCLQIFPSQRSGCSFGREYRAYEFCLSATSDLGKRYQVTSICPVAPHDPNLERRRVQPQSSS